jgi:hypothetical protein
VVVDLNTLFEAVGLEPKLRVEDELYIDAATGSPDDPALMLCMNTIIGWWSRSAELDDLRAVIDEWNSLGRFMQEQLDKRLSEGKSKA